jgi:hypothetical protein
MVCDCPFASIFMDHGVTANSQPQDAPHHDPPTLPLS